MSSVEPARHSLYCRLESILGPEHAETLMTYLPRHQADEVATKDDVARLEARFDRLDSRLDQMLRTYVVTTVGTLTALTAIFSLVVTIFV